VRSLTLDGDSHLSTDARWNAVGGDTLVDVIAVARHVLNDHHLAHRTDTCPPTYGHTATCTRLTADIGVPGIGVKEVIHIFKIRRHLSRVYYSAPPPIWSAEYCDERVCLSVCLSVSVCLCVCLSTIISWNYTSDLHQFFLHATYGRGLVLLWRRSGTLRFSGFVYDVIFAHKLIGCSTSLPG